MSVSVRQTKRRKIRKKRLRRQSKSKSQQKFSQKKRKKPLLLRLLQNAKLKLRLVRVRQTLQKQLCKSKQIAKRLGTRRLQQRTLDTTDEV